MNGIAPSLGSELSSGSSSALWFSAPFSLLLLSIAAASFLVFYAAATTIDVFLAIEFNTRTERAAVTSGS